MGTRFLQYPSYMCSNLQHMGWTGGQEQYCLKLPKILVTIFFTYIPFINNSCITSWGKVIHRVVS